MSVPVSPSSPRGTLAIVVATASLTLAVGVTTAAMLGYLGARPSADPATRPATSKPAPLVPSDSAPAIVYVPVTPTQTASAEEAAPTAEADPMLALVAGDRYGDDDEDEEHEHHARRSHDDDD